MPAAARLRYSYHGIGPGGVAIGYMLCYTGLTSETCDRITLSRHTNYVRTARTTDGV